MITFAQNNVSNNVINRSGILMPLKISKIPLKNSKMT